MDINKKKTLFDTVYQDLSQALYRYAYYQSKNQQTAEDLVQEAYVKYWNKMETIDRGKEKSYLYAIIKNLWLNRIEHHKVVMKFESRTSHTSKVDDPEYMLMMKEFRERLMKAISDLPHGQREVFLMNRIDGLKYREIAELLQISQKAVEKRMSSALLTLRKIHTKV